MIEKSPIIAVGVIVLLIIGFFAVRFFFIGKGQVDVRNDAAEAIVDGEMVVCRQRFVLGEIPPRAVKHISYRIDGEGDYAFRLRFASGRTVAKNVGYVTVGIDNNDSIAITNDDVVLERAEAQSRR
ncbi:MAG TPA: hypothetical protein VJ281_02675 [Chthoniobacterales bacterium]|jgi:hypothetical protein|nr:hypothetical protein [Chthoniobacterales bacterium]